MHTKKTVSRCGFTLVELIVVLVILAALAALLVPALTGYIDKANKQKGHHRGTRRADRRADGGVGGVWARAADDGRVW